MSSKMLNINPDQVQKLAAIGCTDKEIGEIVGCSHDTLTRRFKEQLVAGRANGKASLRRKQWEIALGGNVSMLIWLGKQVLGQTDKLHQTNGPEEINVVIRKPTKYGESRDSRPATSADRILGESGEA